MIESPGLLSHSPFPGSQCLGVWIAFQRRTNPLGLSEIFATNPCPPSFNTSLAICKESCWAQKDDSEAASTISLAVQGNQAADYLISRRSSTASESQANQRLRFTYRGKAERALSP